MKILCLDVCRAGQVPCFVCVCCVILNLKSAALKLNVMLVVNCLFQLDANNVNEIFIDIYVYFHRLHVVLLGPACVVLSPCSSIVIVQQKSHASWYISRRAIQIATVFYTLQLKHSFLKLLHFLGIVLTEATNTTASIIFVLWHVSLILFNTQLYLAILFDCDANIE